MSGIPGMNSPPKYQSGRCSDEAPGIDAGVFKLSLGRVN
jgi:hypothetical protein